MLYYFITTKEEYYCDMLLLECIMRWNPNKGCIYVEAQIQNT